MELLRYSYGLTPDEVIQKRTNEECPSGYRMYIRNQPEWKALADAVNQGIDSHLEAVTERSSLDASTGLVNIHPDELHVLLRRMLESGDEEAESLRSAILDTLEIEEI